ncbi:MAG: hypothetical protein QM784_17195 [Polyangiaceae bacterium]
MNVEASVFDGDERITKPAWNSLDWLPLRQLTARTPHFPQQPTFPILEAHGLLGPHARKLRGQLEPHRNDRKKEDRAPEQRPEPGLARSS